MSKTGSAQGLATRKVYNSGSSAAAFTDPGTMPDWAEIIGSGTTILLDEAGNSVSLVTDAAQPARVVPGPWSGFTSTTATRVTMGNGRMPPLVVPATGVASGTTIADAGNFTAATTVEAALQEIYQDAESALGFIPLPALSFYLLTGAPLAVFANATTTVPGSSFDGSKSAGVRWNNDAAPDAITRAFDIPPDMDVTANATLHIRAAKTGATNNAGNTPTFAVGLFNQVDGALYDADTDFGGTSSAMLPAATAKTIQNVTLTLALTDLAAYPASATITIKPTAGTLNTDDLIFVSAYILYKRKLRTS